VVGIPRLVKHLPSDIRGQAGEVLVSACEELQTVCTGCILTSVSSHLSLVLPGTSLEVLVFRVLVVRQNDVPYDVAFMRRPFTTILPTFCNGRFIQENSSLWLDPCLSMPEFKTTGGVLRVALAEARAGATQSATARKYEKYGSIRDL
jgi:hypothetical protein